MCSQVFVITQTNTKNKYDKIKLLKSRIWIV